ncbi:MAG: TonB family protein [Alistipes sp.]|nr:TonB family protein [Alistipes sp.]
MEAKKSPKADLRNKRGLFFQIGMVVSLMVMVGVFSSSQAVKTPPPVVTDPSPVIPTEEPPITREKKQTSAPNVVFNPQNWQVVPNSTEIDHNIVWVDPDDDFLPEPYKPADEAGVDDGAPVWTAEQMPTFMGGDLMSFRSWVNLNIVYPRQAIDNGISGRVTLTFVIEKDGTLTNIEVLQSPDRILSQEAIRVLENSLKWEPGRHRNTPVRVRFNLPVDFQLK